MRNALIIAAVALVLSVGVVSSQNILTQYCNPTPNNPAAIVANVAPWYCSSINPAVALVWVKWAPIALIAVMFSYAIATLMFMFGVAMRNDKLRTFGTGELYEATASALMVILFGFIAAVMFGLLPSITSGPINPFDASLTYIGLTINSTYAALSSLFYISSTAYAISTFAVGGELTSSSLSSGAIGLPGAGSLGGGGNFQVPNVFAFFELPLIYFIFWPSWIAIAFMFEASISLYTQFYLIVFFMYAAVPVFLIPGVIFRALIPTRNFGAMLIAIAIGFYFIMPTLFSVAYYFTNNNISTQLAQSEAVLNRYTNSTTNLAAVASPDSPLASTISQIQSTFGSYWLSILFFPALIVGMTYMLVTQIAELLGGFGKGSGKLRALV